MIDRCAVGAGAAGTSKSVTLLLIYDGVRCKFVVSRAYALRLSLDSKL